MKISKALSLNSIRSCCGSAWTPAEISTVGWWDPSDSGTITEAGGFVSQLDDKSGNAKHLTQGTGANQFETGADTIGGLNAIQSIGNKYMTSPALSYGATGDLSVFMVARVDAVDNGADSIWSLTGATQSNQIDAVSTTQFDGRTNTGGGIGPNDAWTGGPYEGPSVYEVWFDWTTTSSLYAKVDNVVVNGAPSAYTTQMSTDYAFKMFTNGTVARFLDGAVGEVIIVTDVSSSGRDQIRNYLLNKWSI